MTNVNNPRDEEAIKRAWADLERDTQKTDEDFWRAVSPIAREREQRQHIPLPERIDMGIPGQTGGGNHSQSRFTSTRRGGQPSLGSGSGGGGGGKKGGLCLVWVLAALGGLITDAVNAVIMIQA